MVNVLNYEAHQFPPGGFFIFCPSEDLTHSRNYKAIEIMSNSLRDGLAIFIK